MTFNLSVRFDKIDRYAATCVTCQVRSCQGHTQIDKFGRLFVEKQHVRAIVRAEIDVGTFHALSVYMSNDANSQKNVISQSCER